MLTLQNEVPTVAFSVYCVLICDLHLQFIFLRYSLICINDEMTTFHRRVEAEYLSFRIKNVSSRSGNNETLKRFLLEFFSGTFCTVAYFFLIFGIFRFAFTFLQQSNVRTCTACSPVEQQNRQKQKKPKRKTASIFAPVNTSYIFMHCS